MKFYTVKEFASEIRMSESYVRQRIFRREIPYLKIGSRVFLTESTRQKIIKDAVVEPK